MKSKALIPALAIIALAGFSQNVVAGADSAAGAAYEQMVNGRIAVDYYNKYVYDIVDSLRDNMLSEVPERMVQADKAVESGNAYDAPSGLSNNFRNCQRVLTEPARVPNFYSKEDLALFKDGLEKIKADAGALVKICEEYSQYFRNEFKNDKGKKYLADKAKIQELVTRLNASVDAVAKRAYDMAHAGELLYWKQDRALGYFVSTMNLDTQPIRKIYEIVKNPELEKAGNTLAGDAVAKIEKYLAEFKASIAKNAELTTPALNENMAKYKKEFYVADAKEFVEQLEKDAIPHLKEKGALTSADVSRATGHCRNLLQDYAKFIDQYTYNGGIAIKNSGSED